MAEKTKSVPVKTEEGRRETARHAWEPLASLREEIDNLFDEFRGDWMFGPRRRRGWLRQFRTAPFAWSLGVPAVDVIDKDKEILLKAELPGLDESDIEIRLTDTSLTISGEKKEEREEGEREGNYYLSERRYGSFQRSFPIPEGINREKVEAAFQKGVLTITLPKTPAAQKKSRTIKVKSKD